MDILTSTQADLAASLRDVITAEALSNPALTFSDIHAALSYLWEESQEAIAEAMEDERLGRLDPEPGSGEEWKKGGAR